MKPINYALVEEKRPPIYTAMKYWGKKPHNIWREYIEKFTPQNGIILDPFCGSAISAIEALKVDRKAICFDINPISSFFIESYVGKFDDKLFKKEVLNIIDKVKNDEIYKKLWEYNGIIHNLKYDCDVAYEVCASQFNRGKYRNLEIKEPSELDKNAIAYSKTLDLKKLKLSYVDEPFYDSKSFSANFIKKVGGNNFKFLWTERNLYVLSLIFKSILDKKDEVIKKQLLFAFIMTTHLCCKMNIPRRDSARRNFSTSWGRSAYVCSSRQMEQNPLIVFFNSCFGKQSVESALISSNSYIRKDKRKLKKVSISDKGKNYNSFDLKYGAINVLAIDEYINEKSIDFIITDPPYGGLVQYLDLSYIWNVWLKHYDKSFSNIDFNSEITINKKFDLTNYETKMTSALKKLNRILKDDGKMVITFHNQKIEIWNSFIRSLQNSNFIIEKVIHQKNRRSGESVVANPYGTSGTDFYIRCAKNLKRISTNSSDRKLSEAIVEIAINAIARRNEPTPFLILHDAILAEITSNGYLFSHDNNTQIKLALESELNKTFVIINEKNKGGILWWLKEPNRHISHYEVPLKERVDRAILSLLKDKGLVRLDDALGVIYKNFPNGLTPDEDKIKMSLAKFASQSSGGWVYNKNSISSIEATTHSKYIYNLIRIAKRLGLEVYVGKREQPETIEEKGKLLKLKDFCNYTDLPFEKFGADDSEYAKSRISMIDVLFIKNNKIKFAIEVENSTNIISALHRCSVLGGEVIKIIVIPDERNKELLNLKDPLSLNEIKTGNWKYLLYSELDKLIAQKKPSLEVFLKDIQ